MHRWFALFPCLIATAALPAQARRKPKEVCTRPAARQAYKEGFGALKQRQTETAGAAFRRCLKAEPQCHECLYELGWVHWARGEWDECIHTWERLLEVDPDHVGASNWLVQARRKKKGQTKGAEVYVPLGVTSRPANAPLQLTLVGRFQSYNANPTKKNDHYDTDIFSPKSAKFLPDGSKMYVNSLEGMKTVVYDPHKLRQITVIEHQFGPEDEALFAGQTSVFGYRYNRRSRSGNPNHFSGKPVESALSHGGTYLWVPYYRRDFDYGATSPSAVSIIDTRTDRIVRVLPTGPIPKYVAISPDDKWAAITHWGDNTLGMIDISSGDPQKFAYRPERLVVERVLPQKGLAGKNRDSACGYCLRGTVFSPDGSVLLVARMGGGGIAGFDVASGEYLGTVTGEKPTPRHLLISDDGKWLYLSSNRSGYVSRVPLSHVLGGLKSAAGKTVPISGFEEVFVGGGARTIALSPDGDYAYAACNLSAQLVAVKTDGMEVVARVRTDSHAVGLAVSPDGKQIWTTSQGRKGRGGNSVCVFSVTSDSPAEQSSVDAATSLRR